MALKAFLLACTTGLAIAGGVAAQQSRYVVTVAPTVSAHGFEKVNVSKATIGANPIRIWANSAIDPDCSEHAPGATLTIVEQPTHGVATISDEPFYAAFPATNPRSACNSQKVPGHQAFYTAATGYTGHDRLVLLGGTPDGHVRRITVDIDVR
jgi:hypothetical protein